MNKKLQLLILFLSLGIYTTTFAQPIQSEFINYQGVASNAAGEIMVNETITIGIGLRFGSATATVNYTESHSITTDTYGVFSLKIGNGTGATGDYNTLIRNGIAPFITVSINGTEVGTTELNAVPYAIRAGNIQWLTDSANDIINNNSGTVKVKNNLEVGGNIQLQLGAAPNEISIDGTLAGNSDKAIPTEKAVKTYIDANAGGGATKIDDLTDAKSDNDGFSLFLGIDAGANDDGSNNLNVGVGYRALYKNTTGSRNTANGFQALYRNITGSNNTANGINALNSNTTGSNNTANGYYALYLNESGVNNTANGYGVLYYNTTGSSNTANGFQALYRNNTGTANTANGVSALYSNTTGVNNTANGNEALYSNTTGSNNAANGYQALYKNTTGHDNTANGNEALYSNTTGVNNTANGYQALYSNKSTSNTANGSQSLFSNTEGDSNTANGYQSLYSNTEGGYNIANGSGALYWNTTGSFNTAIGNQTLVFNTTGNENTAIGYNALGSNKSGSNNIAIGYNASVPNAISGSNQVRIGNPKITHAGIQVAWTITSDAAWKDDIQPLVYGLNLVSQLKPVDYVRKNNEDNNREIGFIAQDVELLLNKLGYTNTGMLTTDDEGRLSLRYNDFIPILTKAIQEQQKIIDGQNAKINGLTAEVNQIKTILKKLSLAN